MDAWVAIFDSSCGLEDHGMLNLHAPQDNVGELSAESAYGDRIRKVLAASRSVITTDPLALSVWAFQQRQTAKRIISFTDKGLFWECRTCVASQSMPQMLYRDIGNTAKRTHSRLTQRSWKYRFLDGRFALVGKISRWRHLEFDPKRYLYSLA